jgi:uncharacterized protein (TIGR02271 family)
MNDRIEAQQLVGAQLVGAGQEKIGTIGQVFLDDETGAPQWVTVSIGLLSRSENFVPLAGAQLVEDGKVQVPYGKDQVKDAPSVDADAGHLDPAEEAALYRYYGMGGGEVGTDASTQESGAWFQEGREGQEGYDTSGPTTDDAMTRSEERLRAATERVEAGRARLRKYIVTETQQVTVPVTREEVRVEREPITDENRGAALDGPELSEEEHEVVLTEERPVVTTEAVPVERVRLAKHTEQSEQTVSADVRKERIELEGDGRTGETLDEDR